MGLEVDREDFEESDFAAFDRRLQSDLEALGELLERPGFGEGETTIGAEVEFSLVDADGRPRLISRSVMNDALEPRLAFELDRFNLEYNASPVRFRGEPFTALAAELDAALAVIDGVARRHGGRLALIGILPTLEESDVQSSAMTKTPRFRALSAGLRRLRSAPFQIEIEGDERLALECDDVTMEGANTSFQLHLRVAPRDYAKTFNAAQLATAPVLAACTNSPTFLSRRLWRETRVALFGRAVDYRIEGPGWRPARVSFGHGWVRGGALELFRESVLLHRPLLPVVGDEDPVAVVRAGGVPQLGELKLHHGTVWSWNRAVYDAGQGGHLRIELRALPTGPTVIDMMANAAFSIGLTLGLRERVEGLLPAIPFRLVHDNFYRAAQAGLDSVLMWPCLESPSPRAYRAADLVERLLPIAREGLETAGIDAREVEGLLRIVEERTTARSTGADWQRARLDRLEQGMERGPALVEMFGQYLVHQETGRPVHEWPPTG